MPLKKRKVATHGTAPLVHSIPANSGVRGSQSGAGPLFGGPPPGGGPFGRGPRPRPRPRRRRLCGISPSPLVGEDRGGGVPRGTSPCPLAGEGRGGKLPRGTSPSPFAGEGRGGGFSRRVRGGRLPR